MVSRDEVKGPTSPRSLTCAFNYPTKAMVLSTHGSQLCLVGKLRASNQDNEGRC